MIGPLFSQSAWNNVTFTGAETRDPGRTFPRAMILGCSVVILLYLLANVAYVVTLPLSAIQTAKNDRVGTALLEAILGPRGEAVMAGAILISTFGCVNGLILAGARIYYAMAADGLFFRGVATTNRFHVPAVALVAQGLWAALLALPVTVTPIGQIGRRQVRQRLQRAPGIHHPRRRHVLCPDGRRGDRPAAQGAPPAPPLPDDRLTRSPC